MSLHPAADYGGAFVYSDDQDDLVTLGTLYDLLAAMKDHNHALDKGTPVQRVVFGTEANRPTTTPNEGWLYVSTDTHALWFADGAQWNQVFVLSDETIPVSAGGTGDATLLLDGVLLGNGTDPIKWTAVGPDHSLLQGHTAAAPDWSTTPTVDGLNVDGDEHITGDLVVDGSISAGSGLATSGFTGTGTHAGVAGDVAHIIDIAGVPDGSYIVHFQISYAATTGTTLVGYLAVDGGGLGGAAIIALGTGSNIGGTNFPAAGVSQARTAVGFDTIAVVAAGGHIYLDFHLLEGGGAGADINVSAVALAIA